MGRYREEIREALGDSYLGAVLDKFARQYEVAREEAFAGIDTRALFAEIAAIKDEALKNIPELYETFKREAEKRGVGVSLARDARECRETILKIAEETGSRKIIKTKSMTAEEIGLNEALIAGGLEVCETDLGEWIVQLRGERPTHMVLPAIHLSREAVAETFSGVAGTRLEPDIEKLVRFARRELRRKFLEADMAVTGANFALAETGTLGILTNEGNGGLATSLPGTVASVVGLEKLLAGPGDLYPILKALPRSATAQKITAYATFLTGNPGFDRSGKKRERRVVFLDNGRSRLLGDEVFRSVLRCVRCGACANLCPVYRLVGGRVLGHVYVGAAGLLFTHFFHGADEARHIVANCIGCEACKDLCPAGIDLPGLVFDLRDRLAREEGPSLWSLLLSVVLPDRKLWHGLLKAGRFVQKPFARGGFVKSVPAVLTEEQDFRAIPALPPENFRELVDERDLNGPGDARVSIFAGCAHEFMYPGDLVAGVRLLVRKGVSVSFPVEQACCGLPALTLGGRKTAAKIALKNLEIFLAEDTDHIISLCPSCASHMKNRYPALLGDMPELSGDLAKFARRIVDFSAFLFNVLKYSKEDFESNSEKAAFHGSCHQRLGLGAGREPRELLAAAASYVRTEDEELCCGFGGTYSLKFPEISKTLTERKLDGYERAGASVVVTDCPGCVMELSGVEERRRRKLPVEHMAGFLHRLLKKEGGGK
jgi:iron-sulfur cluster protein